MPSHQELTEGWNEEADVRFQISGRCYKANESQHQARLPCLASLNRYVDLQLCQSHYVVHRQMRTCPSSPAEASRVLSWGRHLTQFTSASCACFCAVTDRAQGDDRHSDCSMRFSRHSVVARVPHSAFNVCQIRSTLVFLSYSACVCMAFDHTCSTIPSIWRSDSTRCAPLQSVMIHL